ncbi:magnesium-translocating P-type ATPase [Victivallis sp. Marseille-Q1083]|uniref:magnesium-translocating P-type ATPase n=1 Tax=Victivallis sp. Marseille-Q1083 TaxID=2717288 RepID=UPI0015895DE6|nr:magnesium-translocating P-type ATPase [Victivallis sp. Marseille-Q1083]
MKLFFTFQAGKHNRELRRQAMVAARRLSAAKSETGNFVRKFGLANGLSEPMVKHMRNRFGANRIVGANRDSILKRLIGAFVNPFTGILLLLAAVSFLMDVRLAAPEDKDPTTVIIILTMVLISGLLRFIQETRSGNAAARLSEMVKTTATVERRMVGKIEVPLEELVVGDIVHLAAGDMLPADVRILRAKDFFVSQASLTGESEPVEKNAAVVRHDCDAVTDSPNLAFAGSNVVSGSATALVIAVGSDTLFGDAARSLAAPPTVTGFEKGVNAVSWVLIRFMLIMVPVVLVVNGITKGNWEAAILFAISVAVGLTPEMLPMIVTTCLAKGAVLMSRRKTIIKNLNAIQNLGAMDVLCTDKTGTLTMDKVVLEYHMNVHGETDSRVLRHAFLNSFYQTGLKNLMDIAIIDRTGRECGDEATLRRLTGSYEKVDEIPFDFERRRMSVVVADRHGKTQMITKGAVEEMLGICSHVEYRGSVEPLTAALRRDLLATVDTFNRDGLRVIAVAQKTNPPPVDAFSVADETGMVLIGYLAFLDPPKSTAAAAVRALREYGVATKVLTGDNEKVTRCVCRQVGLRVDNLLLGAELEKMSKAELARAVERTNVFAKLSPQQKARLVQVLRSNGHTVGFLGDGINDAAALKAADVGISVDTAVDIAKESADVVLLEKDLMVLENGILEGRRTYANMIKYIKMTASSNFGNMFSVLIASAFLPFLPMLSIHLLLLNLIYDISCTAIPWDNVDIEYLRRPRPWDASSVAGFMLRIGPVSSVFDITTYLLMYFVICPSLCGGQLFTQLTDPVLRDWYVALFQTGWFVESMWSQTLVIHLIRTPKIPFMQSRASLPVFLLTFAGIAFLTVIPFTPLGGVLGLTPLPGIYFFWLLLTIVLYMFAAQAVKKNYIRRYGELL